MRVNKPPVICYADLTMPEKDTPGAAIPKALFELGQIVVTRGATISLATIDRHALQLVSRHVEGEWGNLPPEDIEENRHSLEQGFRLFSSYDFDEGSKFYVITERDRSVTTVLTPDEY